MTGGEKLVSTSDNNYKKAAFGLHSGKATETFAISNM